MRIALSLLAPGAHSEVKDCFAFRWVSFRSLFTLYRAVPGQAYRELRLFPKKITTAWSVEKRVFFIPLSLPTQPPLRGPVGVAALRSRSSFSFNFFLSPSKTFLTRFNTSGFPAWPLQSSGRYGGPMMTLSWAMICSLCHRTGKLLQIQSQQNAGP